ncbi:expressed unknown protein [Seminavis robusta]|uniref:EF-hand domain-containing protein n=1 Tax=Seminavis robusta TaxID=568900 RepID=A0A9N8H548_9STRA|nr:expressed unknown protein [Seminavis robusta]|eukprot:Sro65_g036960.1 n/a (93) ;mRNA; r:122855-123133
MVKISTFLASCTPGLFLASRSSAFTAPLPTTQAHATPLNLSAGGNESLERVTSSLTHQAEELESGGDQEREQKAAHLFESIDQDGDGQLKLL